MSAFRANGERREPSFVDLQPFGQGADGLGVDGQGDRQNGLSRSMSRETGLPQYSVIGIAGL